MKQPLRYFSIGLFAAAIVLLIGLYFSDTEKVEELAAEELIPYVEQEGFHVLSNEEYIALSVNNTDEKEQSKESAEDKEKTPDKDSQEKANEETNNPDKSDSTEDSKEEDKNSKDEDEKDEVVTYTIKIEAGMVPSSISSQLEENNIIEDAFEFDQYLEENDYSQYVQLGEFKVSSDMSFYEIAEKITN